MSGATAATLCGLLAGPILRNMAFTWQPTASGTSDPAGVWMGGGVSAMRACEALADLQLARAKR